MSSVRSVAVLTTKPRSTVTETPLRTLAVTAHCYLAAYRVTRTEPAWRGAKHPSWTLYQSVSFELRLYPHAGAREHQVLFACDNTGNRGGTQLKQNFERWAELLAKLAARDSELLLEHINETFRGSRTPKPEGTPLEAALQRAADGTAPQSGVHVPPASVPAKPVELPSPERRAELLAEATQLAAAHAAKLHAAQGLDLGVKHRLVGREAIDCTLYEKREEIARTTNEGQVNRSGETVASEAPPTRVPPATSSPAGAGTGGPADDLPPPMPERPKGRNDLCAGCGHERCWHDLSCGWLSCECSGFVEEPAPALATTQEVKRVVPFPSSPVLRIATVKPLTVELSGPCPRSPLCVLVAGHADDCLTYANENPEDSTLVPVAQLAGGSR